MNRREPREAQALEEIFKGISPLRSISIGAGWPADPPQQCSGVRNARLSMDYGAAEGAAFATELRAGWELLHCQCRRAPPFSLGPREEKGAPSLTRAFPPPARGG